MPRRVPDEDLLDDLRRVANEVDREAPSYGDYEKLGDHGTTTVINRFGSWKDAVREAGLTPVGEITDQEILDDLRRVADEVDRESLRIHEYDHKGEYNQSTPIDRFGSWNAAVREAGLTPTPEARRIPKEDLLADLQRVADEIGRGQLPSPEYEDRGKYGSATVIRRWRCWNDAIRKVGLTPSQEWDISDEDLLDDLRRVANEIESKPIVIPDYEDQGEYGTTTVIDRFGSWKDAVREAGLTPLNRKVSDGVLLDDLRRVADETDGETLLRAEYEERGDYHYSTHARRFGSWRDAVEKAGLTPPKKKIPDEDLLDDLRRVADEIERENPRKADYDKRGEYSADTLKKRFGLWSDAVREVGLTPVIEWQTAGGGQTSTQTRDIPVGKKIPDEDLLDDLRRVADKTSGNRLKALDYDDEGKYSKSTLIQRFGSWVEAVEKIGCKSYLKRISTEELIASIQNLSSGDEAPTSREYAENGKYGLETVVARFGSWENAVRAAGYTSYCYGRAGQILTEELIASIQSLGSENKPPTCTEYDKHGEYGLTTVIRRFGTWTDAVSEVGYTTEQIRKAGNPTTSTEDKELLLELRRLADGEVGPTHSTIVEGKYSATPYYNRFGSIWKAIVQAGLKPQHRCPATQSEYVNFIETAFDYGHPVRQLTGLLLAFTGLGTALVGKFSTEWVININTAQRDTAIQVPSKHLRCDEDWIGKVPIKWHNPETGEQEDTHVEGLLNWAIDHKQELYSSQGGIEYFCSKINEDAEMNKSQTANHIRMSLGTHLAERGAPPWFIQKQTGVGFRGGNVKVEDFYLWNHVHRDIDHPDYYPPDVVLNPVEQ